jgi:hypothetical protein
MGIGGSAQDALIVFITEDNLTFWNLVDPERTGDDEIVRLYIGGQDGEFRRSQLARAEHAIRAAHEYFLTGTRASDLVWAHDS